MAYPIKTCSIERLVRQPRLVAAALAGHKTQQRRDGVYAYPGETFMLDATPFTLTELSRQRLGDMTERDALAEGYENLDTYRNLILKMHPNMAWNNTHWVWVHTFAKSAITRR